jgi:hypothetical protein
MSGPAESFGVAGVWRFQQSFVFGAVNLALKSGGALLALPATEFDWHRVCQ